MLRLFSTSSAAAELDRPPGNVSKKSWRSVVRLADVRSCSGAPVPNQSTDYAYPTNARTELHGTSTIPIHFRTNALHPLTRDDEALNATMI
jgi:hypothetical protein